MARQVQGSSAIIRTFINACWFCFKWSLAVALAAGVGAGVYLYHRFDEELRREIERLLREHYQQLAVSIRAARFVPGEGITIHDLVILEPGASGPQAELIHLEEIFLACPVELLELVHGLPDFRRVTVHGMTLRATRRPDATWSTARLLPLPLWTSEFPGITVENGTLEIFDPLRNPSSTLTLSNLQLALTPPAQLSSDVACWPRPPQTDEYFLRGTMLADYVRRIEIEGIWEYHNRHWNVRGRVEGFELCPEFAASLPSIAETHVQAIEGLRAQTSLTYSMDYQAERQPRVQFAVEAELSRGRLDHSQLPYPLNDLRAKVHLDNAGARIDELTARNGQSTLSAHCHRPGYAPDSPLTLHVRAQRILLDDRLMNLEHLPQDWRTEWDRYLPSGELDAELALIYDGQTWQAEAISAQLLNVSFTHARFPYRLEHGRGAVTFRDQNWEVGLKAYAGAEEVRLDGQWSTAEPGGAGWFRVQSDHIPLDEKLFSALTAETGRIVRSLRPRGTLGVQAQFEQSAGQQPTWHVLVGLNRCAISYEGFPYPLDNVRGAIEARNESWTIGPLSGTNDTGHVTCQGTFDAAAEALALHFEGTHVPLEDELRDAHRDPRIRRLWDDLHPSGTVHVDCHASFQRGQSAPDLTVRLEPDPGQVSVQPRNFPYRVERLGGQMTYRDGSVELKRLSGWQGQTRLVQANGRCQFAPEGGWQLELRDLAIDRLELNRELVSRLPARLRDTLTPLDPNARVNVRGQVQLAADRGVQAPVTSAWRLDLDIHEGTLSSVTRLENMYGGLSLDGRYDGQKFHCGGELALDSLTCRGLQFTGIRGPLWIDSRRVLLGSVAAQAQGGTSRRRPITADVSGGKLYGDFGITLSSPPSYRVDARLVEADLSRTAREWLQGRQDLQGKLLAEVHLAGSDRGAHTLSGQGNLQLRQADVYQLPTMIRLLSVLSVKPPEKTAFTESDINFHIDAGHIYFDTIEFKGHAVSLRGRGEMNLETELALNFYAVVGREQLNLPLVGGVLRGASQQIMQIRVHGKLADPLIEREALPGVKRSLEQLGLDFGRNNERTGALLGPVAPRPAVVPRSPRSPVYP